MFIDYMWHLSTEEDTRQEPLFTVETFLHGGVLLSFLQVTTHLPGKGTHMAGCGTHRGVKVLLLIGTSNSCNNFISTVSGTFIKDMLRKSFCTMGSKAMTLACIYKGWKVNIYIPFQQCLPNCVCYKTPVEQYYLCNCT